MILVIYSILLALEVLIIAVLISNAIPFAHNPIRDILLIWQQNSIFPKRDLQLYAFFLSVCFGIYAVMLIIYRKRAGNIQWPKELNHQAWMQGLWVFGELYGAFKIIMLNSPLWAQIILYLSLAASLLTKIFWPEWAVFVKKFWPRLQFWILSNFSGWRGNALAALFIFCVIYIPDPQAVVAQLYMGDQFHNWDIECLGAVYGLFNGFLPDVDVYSQYGLGLPVFLAGTMKLFGGFDYLNVIKSLFWLGTFYYIAWFFILRRWFYSGLLAFAAIIWGMRSQMFLMIVIPTVWHEMTASVLRFYFDGLFFWFLYKHVTTHRRIFLWGAAGAVGIGTYHIVSTGAGLLFALAAYIGIHCVVPDIRPYMIRSRQDYLSLARIIFSIPVFVMLLMWLTVKNNIFKPEFWNNLMEFHLLYANGFGSNYLTGALQHKEYLFVAGGLGYVLFYVGSILYAINLIYFKKADYKLVFTVPLAIYGLCLHAYYIETSIKYLSFGLPGVFLLFFWIDYASKQLSALSQKRVRIAMLGGSLFALMSAPMFTAYPNLFNLSRNPIVDTNVAIKLDSGGYYFNQLYIDFPEWVKLPVNSLGEKDEKLKFEKDFQTDKQLIEFYKQDTDFSKDCHLIRRLTPEGARVPLISSFEILILSEAKRKPFFYYFPYLSSRLMRTRSFVTSTIFTKTQLAKMIDQLEQSKPKYVFMERIFLTPQVPMWYGYQFEDSIELIRYIEARYQPEQIGQFLVAMRRVR